MPVTSHDVARAAGVSQPTVSRALRDMPGIAPGTLERIRTIARELGYVPSERGRSLSTQRTRCIGIVAADLKNPFYPELVEPLRDGLERLGYRVLLIPDSSETDLQLSRIADGTVDGVIITTASTTSRLPHELSERGIPFVLVNRDVDGIEADRCIVDNQGGAVEVADLFVSTGHSAIGAVFGPIETSTGRDREAAFRVALRGRHVTLLENRVRRGPFEFEAGRVAAIELLQQDDRATAIFCANDVLAIGAYDGAVSIGMTPGRDVAIVGFDDISMAGWDVFALSTVRGDLSAVAAHAVRMLTQRIEDRDAPFESVTVPTSLVLRRSHGYDRASASSQSQAEGAHQ